MKMLRALAAAVLLAISAPEGAAAQSQPAVEEGMRVRVSAPIFRRGLRVKGTDRWIVGTVRETTPTSLVLQPDPADSASRVEIPYDVMSDLDLSLGIGDERSSIRRGATQGALTGAGIGVFFYGMLSIYPGGGPEEGHWAVDTSPWIMGRNTAILTTGGALVGALVGSRSRERWQSLHIPRVRVDPARERASLSFSVDF